MIRTRVRMPSVGLRAAAGLVVGAVVLGAAVGQGLASERRQIPAAVAQLDQAVVASADALACFQGVQDDLFIDTAGDFDAASVAAAQHRLATCPVAAAVAGARVISVPAAAPIEPGSWRTVRADLVAGQADAQRGALDLAATRRAMVTDLADHRNGSDVVLAYRAAYADNVLAGQVESDAAAHLREMGVSQQPAAG